MSPRNNILKFAGFSALYFCLLTIPWPGPWAGPTPYLMDAYRWAFRSVGNAFFLQVGDGGSVQFSLHSQALHEADTAFRITNKRSRAGGNGEIKAIYTGYRPTAFVAALILATPVPWRRRGLSLLLGIVLVGAFVVCRTWLRLAMMMCNDDPIRAYSLGDGVQGFLGALNAVFVRSPAVGYIIPALIWLIVTIRKEDWSRFGIRLGPEVSSEPRSAPPKKLRPAKAGNN